jgi:hypothetical protein
VVALNSRDGCDQLCKNLFVLSPLGDVKQSVFSILALPLTMIHSGNESATREFRIGFSRQ